MARNNSEATALYRTVRRWHFYAGLFVIPFILILSVTGAFYLFKPQVERWEEQAWRNLPLGGAVTPDVQVDAALANNPGAQFHSYRLPEQEGDAAMVHLALADGKTMRDVFLSPQGRVMGSLDPEMRLMAIDQRIHGQLLLGPRGSWLVELAASWAIVMILTGLYLWWPRGRGLAGVVWPRLASGSRIAWRDMHAVTGFWVAGLALVLLFTGLPWASVWGGAFKAVRAEMGWTEGKQDWTIGGRDTDPNAHAMHREHDHATMMAPDVHSHQPPKVSLSEIVAKAKAEKLAFPVIVTPPGGAQRFGATPVMAWTVRSEAQNRPLRVSISYDGATGAEIRRETFAGKHRIDRVIGYGIAWHEGQLFGWANQAIGVLTALALITLAVSGCVMWWRRRPEGTLGAPPLPTMPSRMGGLVTILILLAALLPMLALSLVVLVVFERLLPRLWKASMPGRTVGIPTTSSVE